MTLATRMVSHTASKAWRRGVTVTAADRKLLKRAAIDALVGEGASMGGRKRHSPENKRQCAAWYTRGGKLVACHKTAGPSGYCGDHAPRGAGW